MTRMTREFSHLARVGWSPAQIDFHADYCDDTVPYEPHRRTLKSRLYEDHTRLSLSYQADGSVVLSEIECALPARGHGGRALGWLCELADAHRIALRLQPCAFGDENLLLHNRDRLVAWYMRRGFVFPAGYSKMLRLPRGLRP